MTIHDTKVHTKRRAVLKAMAGVVGAAAVPLPVIAATRDQYNVDMDWFVTPEASPFVVQPEHLQVAYIQTVARALTRLQYAIHNDTDFTLHMTVAHTPVSPLLSLTKEKFSIKPHERREETVYGRWSGLVVMDHYFVNRRQLDYLPRQHKKDAGWITREQMEILNEQALKDNTPTFLTEEDLHA